MTPIPRAAHLPFVLFLAACPMWCTAQDGTLDDTFSDDGLVTTDVVGGSYDDANAVIIQPDGKILVGGTAGYEDAHDFGVVRYMPDGSLDDGFSGDGRQTISVSAGNDVGMALALQPDGKVLIGGYSYLPMGLNFTLARFTADGAYDATFGTGGIAIPIFDPDLASIGRALALQPDGKILMAGGGIGGFALIRFNTDGSVDQTFADNGISLCPFPGSSAQANAMAIQSDGKIVLAGYASGDLDSMAVARFDSEGVLDQSFGNGGRATATLPNGAVARAVVVRADGKIMTAGASSTHAAVARFTADGHSDITFFGNGITILNVLPSILSDAFDLAALPDGKTLVCGQIFNSSNDFFLARLDTTGAYDLTFDGDGRLSTDFNGLLDIAHAMAIQPDGKVVVAGIGDGGFQDMNFAVARYNFSIVTDVPQHRSGSEVRCYPSPLVVNSVVEYALDRDDVLSISLYDARGVLVSSIADHVRREAGPHRENLSLAALPPPGVYSLALSGSHFRAAVRVTVM